MPGENPILNNPYEEPLLHYATNLAGELDYSVVKEGRRIFTPDVQSKHRARIPRSCRQRLVPSPPATDLAT